MVEKSRKSTTELKHERKNRGRLDKQTHNISKHYFSTLGNFAQCTRIIRPEQSSCLQWILEELQQKASLCPNTLKTRRSMISITNLSHATRLRMLVTKQQSWTKTSPGKNTLYSSLFGSWSNVLDEKGNTFFPLSSWYK